VAVRQGQVKIRTGSAAKSQKNTSLSILSSARKKGVPRPSRRRGKGGRGEGRKERSSSPEVSSEGPLFPPRSYPHRDPTNSRRARTPYLHVARREGGSDRSRLEEGGSRRWRGESLAESDCNEIVSLCCSICAGTMGKPSKTSESCNRSLRSSGGG